MILSLKVVCMHQGVISTIIKATIENLELGRDLSNHKFCCEQGIEQEYTHDYCTIVKSETKVKPR